MELKKLEIIKNRHGFYDVFVNGETILEMLGEDEIAESVKWIMTEGMKFLEEVLVGV